MERITIEYDEFNRLLLDSSVPIIENILVRGVQFSTNSSRLLIPKKIKNCEFARGGSIKGLEIGSELVFENCLFSKNHPDDAFVFEAITDGKLFFKTTNVFDCKLVLDGLATHQTEVGGTFNNELGIIGGINDLTLRGSGKLISSFSDVTFSNAHRIEYLLLRDLEHNGSITFHGSLPRVLNFAQGTFDTIKFHNVFDVPDLKIGSLETKGEGISVKKFDFSNCNLTGKMEFLGVSFDSISMNHFNSQNGKALFRNIHFKDQVSFESADLSGVRFIDVNFLNAKLKLNSTLLTESLFSNIIWPKNNLIEPNLATKKYGVKTVKLFFKKKEQREKENASEVLELKKQRESYRQLKVISQKNMNTIDMLAFYRNEMRVYWSNMRLNTELSKGDHFLVFLDRYVSNFGQSWLNPLCLLAFFHALICISIWTFESDDYQFWNGDFFSGVKEYFNWIIPVYKAPAEWGTFATVSGVLGRVLGGFFIYHLIKASRKFGKV